MAEKAKIQKHEIVSIESDRDRVRLRPSIYTTSVDAAGCVHIIFEIVDNAIDELTAHDSIGDTVTLIFDKKTKEFTVIDNGGGIPHDGMLKAVSVLSSSGKYDNSEESHFAESGGFNGYGTKLLTFLSDWATFTSCQKGKSLTYKFEDGLLVDTIEGKTKEHGTTATGLISSKILDINGVDVKDIIHRFEEKSYMFPQLKMNLIITENGKTVKEYHYYGKDITSRVNKWKPDTPVVRATGVKKYNILVDITDEKMTERKVTVDVAFGYKEDALDGNADDFIISYANGIKTYTGGEHVVGLKQGIQKWFNEVVKPKFGKRDKELQVTPSDMAAGLCAYVTVKLYDPQFHGQVKDRLDNQEARFAVRDAVYEALCDAKSSEVNPMIEFIKRVTRGRMASKKVRKKDVSSAFSADRLDKFTDVINSTKTTDPELLLLEGDSAASLACSARDPYNQAIFMIKKPANIFDVESDDVAKLKTVFNDIMDICGVEPGKKCDPSKSTMNRILALTDGDIDGDGIAISIICLIAKHCRPMIDAGMVGRILPPAYSIPNGKGKPTYVHTQREFFNKVMKKFIKNVTISYKGHDMSKQELYDFLSKNFVYDTKLDALASRYCCDPRVMEYIAWKYHGNASSQKKSYWMEAMKRYKDVRIIMEHDQLIIDGDIPGSGYLNLALDEHFDKHIHRFKEHQAINESVDGYAIDGEKGKTVYDVMSAMRKYIPDGVKRYKGLGELEPQELHDLCMDKEKRTVIIMKFKDFEDDMEKIGVIMSSKKKFAESRARLITSIRASDLDLDT